MGNCINPFPKKPKEDSHPQQVEVVALSISGVISVPQTQTPLNITTRVLITTELEGNTRHSGSYELDKYGDYRCNDYQDYSSGADK